MTKKISKDKIKTWFVTGASSGIGHEMCKQLLKKGYNVIAVARRIPDFTHENALCLSVDVTQPETIHKAVNFGIEKFGKIDVLVNNAGILSSSTIEDETLDHMKQLMEVNFFGSFNTMNALIPHFRANKNGTIINNTSKSGISPRRFGAAYCSSKHAIEGLTGVCYRECKRFIRTMAFELGWFAASGIKPDSKTQLKNIPEIYRGLNDIDVKVKEKFTNDLPIAVSLIINEIEKEKIPRRFILGRDSLAFALSELNLFNKDYKHSLKIGKPCSPIKKQPSKFFSISNEGKNNSKHKVITILGIKLKFKI